MATFRSHAGALGALSSVCLFLVSVSSPSCGGDPPADDGSAAGGSMSGGAPGSGGKGGGNPAGGESTHAGGRSSGTGSASAAGGGGASGGQGGDPSTGGLGGAFAGEAFDGSCSFDECDGCPVCRESYGDPAAQRWCGHLAPNPGDYVWSTNHCPTESLLGACAESDRLIIQYYYQGSEFDAEALEAGCLDRDGVWF